MQGKSKNAVGSVTQKSQKFESSQRMGQELLPENRRNKYESHIEKKYESSAEIQVTYHLIFTENLYFKSFYLSPRRFRIMHLPNLSRCRLKMFKERSTEQFIIGKSMSFQDIFDGIICRNNILINKGKS